MSGTPIIITVREHQRFIDELRAKVEELESRVLAAEIASLEKPKKGRPKKNEK